MFFFRCVSSCLAKTRPLHALLLVCGVAMLLTLLGSTRLAYCAKIAWWQHPQREQLEIVFPKNTPAPDVRRIDSLTVRISAPREAWGPARELTRPAFTGANLFQELTPEGEGLLVQLQSKAFGFVSQYDAESGRLIIDFFPDPLGGRWMFDPPTQQAPASTPAAHEHALSSTPVQERPGPRDDQTTEIVQRVESPAPVPGPAPALEQPAEAAPETFFAPAPDPGVSAMAAAAPDSGETTGALRAPVLRPAPAPPAQPEPSEQFGVGAVRSRIERVGPEEARPFDDAQIVRSLPERVETHEESKAKPEVELEVESEAAPADTPEAPEITATAEPETVREGDVPARKEAEQDDPAATYRRLLSSARTAMMNAEFEGAARDLRALSVQPALPDDLREEVLYDLADALFSLHLDDLAGNFTAVAGAYEQAMNLNPKSPRAATALRNLGVVHLRVNNLPEAQAYFNVLRREYPHDPLVPSADYYLGDYYLERGDYAQAADHFQNVVENYPEHSIAQQSAVGLSRALYALGFDEQAFQVMDYLEKRWPRYYIDDPSLLELAGIIALRVNSMEPAKQRLLTYYNLVPESENAHMLLARLGDIYLLTGKPDAAKHVFEKTAREYPDEEGGLIAQMRLVEGGIHDDPSLEDMFTAMRAAQVYTHIIENHPQSPLAAVAKVKLAIWQVWNKRLEDSLNTVRDFLADRPQHSLAPKALEVGIEAFTQLVDRNLQDDRHSETLDQWNLNEFLHPLLPEFSEEAVLGLAMAFWKTGDHDRAIQLARPHLRGITPEQAQGFALDLVLGIYLEQQQWEEIVGLEHLRDELALSPDRLRELNYAVALALEHLGRPNEARPIWLALAGDLRLSDAQRGYSLYYLARNSMQEEDLEKVYLYAQEALSLLLLERKDMGKIRDCIAWLTQVTERTGRMQEALAWALEFDQIIDEDDPDWAMSRYRLAQLYQRMHNHDQWRKILTDLQQKDPRGLYGRLAGSALQGRELEDNVVRFGQ